MDFRSKETRMCLVHHVPDALAAFAGSGGIASLDDKVLLDRVEEAVVVIFEFAQFQEVETCSRCFVGV